MTGTLPAPHKVLVTPPDPQCPITYRVLRIARQAGDAILEIYKTDFDVTTKADTLPRLRRPTSPRSAHIAELARLTPEIPLLSEESAEVPYATRRTWRRLLARRPARRHQGVCQA